MSDARAVACLLCLDLKGTPVGRGKAGIKEIQTISTQRGNALKQALAALPDVTLISDQPS
ncbi:hypothetical protein [Marivita sp.]|uniref:hypothetical protein n=1 Tax=Marivita sp. TaxID=2003365 RepID=UPI003F6FEDBC